MLCVSTGEETPIVHQTPNDYDGLPVVCSELIKHIGPHLHSVEERGEIQVVIDSFFSAGSLFFSRLLDTITDWSCTENKSEVFRSHGFRNLAANLKAPKRETQSQSTFSVMNM